MTEIKSEGVAIVAEEPQRSHARRMVVAEDFPCRMCGYNLRGLETLKNCPECSQPVQDSIFTDELRHCDPAWVSRLATGARVVLAGMLISGAGAILVPVLVLVAASTSLVKNLALAQLVPALMVVCGIWMLTSPGFGDTRGEPLLSARRLARWCSVARLLASPLGLLGSLTMLPSGAAPLLDLATLQMALIMLWPTVLVGDIAGLVYIGRIGERIPRPGLPGQATIVAWGYGISQSVVVLITILAMLAGRAAGYSKTAAGVYTLASGAAGIFGIWALVLLGICAVSIGPIARSTQRHGHSAAPRRGTRPPRDEVARVDALHLSHPGWLRQMASIMFVIAILGISGIPIFGTWLLTRPEPGRTGESLLSARRVARGCACALTILVPLLVVILAVSAASRRPGSGAESLGTMAILAAAVLYLIKTLASLSYCSQLAHRIPRHLIAVQCVIAAILFLPVFGLLMRAWYAWLHPHGTDLAVFEEPVKWSFTALVALGVFATFRAAILMQLGLAIGHVAHEAAAITTRRPGSA